MKVRDLCIELTTHDTAEVIGRCVYVGAEPRYSVDLLFPDRTPEAALEAIAKAINDALDAAREIEGAGRD